MARQEASIRIERPPDEVFAYVSEVANNPEWRKNVVRMAWLDDGPMRIGRRGRQTQRVIGREWTVEAEIVEWPPRRVTWQVRQGPVTARSWVRVEPEGSGSIAAAGADGGFNGPIGRLLTRLAEPRMLKQAHLDLETLRGKLEAGPRGDVEATPVDPT